MKRYSSLLTLVLLLLFGLIVPSIGAGAPSPLIELDASWLSDGPLSSWKSKGTLGQSFDVVPVGGAVVAQVDGRNAVTFDGKNHRLVSSFAAPASLTGESGYSVAVWVRNPKIETEEALVCWAPREAGDGKVAQVNYGSSKDFGAVTHWGKGDMGFDGGVPEAGKWHLIVVTYGGKSDPVEKVYVDGKVNASEQKPLTLAAGSPIYIGGAGSVKLFSGAISAVQMYDYALSSNEIAFLSNSKGSKPKAALVSLSADALPAGNLAKWENHGTLGGSFGLVRYAPIVETVDGHRAVSFSNGGWLQSANVIPKGVFTLEIWSRVVQDGASGGATTAALSVCDIAKDEQLRIGLSRELKSGAFAAKDVKVGFKNRPELKSWHQIAYVYTGGTDGTLNIYLDGQLDNQIKCNPAIPAGAPINLGAAWQPGNGIPYAGFDGAISRLCLYDSALSQREIRAHNGMLDAFNPSPAAGGTWDKLDVTLQWEVGDEATKSCDVYFGTDRAAVESAGKTSSFYKGNVAASNTQTGPIKLAIGQTYYWRVDQISADGNVLNKGQVWQFSSDSGKATNPCPRNEISAVPVSLSKLTWTPGKYATKQTIYFASEDNYKKFIPEWTKAELDARVGEFKIPVKLEYGKRYYWHVDSQNGTLSTSTGDIWWFRTEDKLTDTDVTFYAISDLHYSGPDSSRANQNLIKLLNAFPGTTYPDSFGGNVATPRGVVVTGDLTDAGKQIQWDTFVSDYGLNGNASIAYPMYELWGNHDGRSVDVVAQGIKQRNPSRPNLTMISKNGLHYSWDWGKVHFATVNIYPAEVSQIVIANDPIHSLQFLKEDLEKNVGKSGRPVVINMHYGLDGGGAGWWTEAEHQAFYDAIKNYNVVAMLFGHTHGGGNYKWNGYDMINVGGSLAGAGARQFVVFHITDKELVAARRYPDKWGEILRKPITGMNAK